jgi:hypothetical protein
MLTATLSTAFVLLVLSFALFIFFIYRAVRGTVPTIRTIPGLTAFNEVIGRAVETGRPVYFSTGVGRLTGGDMSMTMAGLSLLGHAAKLSADIGADFNYIAAVAAEAVPIAEDMIKTAYREKYRSEQVTFVPTQPTLFSAIAGTYEREKPAANFVLGALYWETVIVCEAGARAGAMQIGGTGRLYQVPFIASLCDYSLIGEELLAAGAYVSGERALLGSIMASDVLRAIIVALSLIIMLGSIFGQNVPKLLGM